MSTSDRITPREIAKHNESDVRITWADGHVSLYSSRQLRLACPCAGCIEEWTGKALLDPTSVPENIHPAALGMVGNYAITFKWSDSHTTGIYSFNFLRQRCPCSGCKGETDS